MLDSIDIPLKNLELIETSETAPFLDIYVKVDIQGHLSARLYDKRDDISFVIINFNPLIVIYQPLASMEFIFHKLIQYALACSLCSDYLQRQRLTSIKLINQSCFFKESSRPYLTKRNHNVPTLG